MSFDREAANKILAWIGRDELAQLGCDPTGIPSPTRTARRSRSPSAIEHGRRPERMA
jgi:hypothetical protein